MVKIVIFVKFVFYPLKFYGYKIIFYQNLQFSNAYLR